MSIWSNIFGSLKSTVKGLFTGIGTGAVAAAGQFASNPQTTDWKPYAAAALVAAVPAVVGALSKDESQPVTSETAQKVAQAVEDAGKAYAAKKADEMIVKLQEQLK